MNIENSILILDEGQNLSRKTMRTITTRCGENTKLFVIGDTRQVINPHINEFNNGLNWLVKLCKGEPNYGHLVLKGRTSRGPITDLILKCGL
jgi:PhoH-like ATPase